MVEEKPVTDEEADCISQILVDISVDTEHLGDMAEVVGATARSLIEHRQRCEAMLSDPPTSLEERRHE